MTVIAVLAVWVLVGASCWAIRRRVHQGIAPGQRRNSDPARGRGLRGRLTAVADAGSVAVEAALITPVFLVIIVGIVEFSAAYRDQLGIESAVRAAARIGSAEPRTSTFANDAASAFVAEGSAISLSNVQQFWVYKADKTSGYPYGTSSFALCPSSTCIAYTFSGGTYSSSGTWAPASQDACSGEEDSIGVYVSYKHSWITSVIATSPLSLTSHTVMRLEPIPATLAGGCK